MFKYIYILHICFLFKSVAWNFSIQGQFWQMRGVEKELAAGTVSLHHCSLNNCVGDLNQGLELWRVRWSASGAMCCTMFAQLNQSMMTVGWQCVPLRRECTVAARKTDFRAFEIVQRNVCCLLLVAFVWKFHLAKFTWKVWSCSRMQSTSQFFTCIQICLYHDDSVSVPRWKLMPGNLFPSSVN